MSETNFSLNDSDNRKVAIQVTGSRDRTKRRNSNYTVIVPYNCLNQTLGQISRTGGKIVDVTIQSSSLPAPNINKKTESPTIISSQPKIIQSTPVQSIASPAQDVVKTDINLVENLPAEPEMATSEESVKNIEKKDLSSRRIRVKKTRLISSKKTIRNSFKGHSTKARRKTKTYLQ